MTHGKNVYPIKCRCGKRGVKSIGYNNDNAPSNCYKFECTNCNKVFIMSECDFDGHMEAYEENNKWKLHETIENDNDSICYFLYKNDCNLVERKEENGHSYATYKSKLGAMKISFNEQKGCFESFVK